MCDSKGVSPCSMHSKVNSFSKLPLSLHACMHDYFTSIYYYYLEYNRARHQTKIKDYRDYYVLYYFDRLFIALRKGQKCPFMHVLYILRLLNLINVQYILHTQNGNRLFDIHAFIPEELERGLQPNVVRRQRRVC